MLQVSIIGGSGYSGAELLRILTRRDDIVVRQVTAHSHAGDAITDVYPDLNGYTELRYDPVDQLNTDDTDVLFFALPSGEAMNIIPQFQGSKTRIIDLGGDLRLPSEILYQEYYGKKHTNPGLLGESVYGLPEINREEIRSSKLIANPGCYPTSIILALYPFLNEGIVSESGIVINSMSGVSGAGRKGSVALSFSEVNESVHAYRVTNHQHNPEIKSVLDHHTGKNISFSFIPHLIPITRGIYTTIVGSVSTDTDEEKCYGILNEYYANEPFVRIVRHVPRIKNVTGTNYCDIYCTIQKKTGQIVIISAIDNLLKGAAGQAVQNMNIMFDLPETRGLA